MRLDSDFSDFYDEVLFNVSSDKTFKRRKDKSMGRRLALNTLKEFNIRTIECDLCANIGFWECEKVVVYMVSNTHDMDNKQIMNKNEAMIYYPNKICVPFIPDDITKCITYKTVIIGRRCFNLILKRNVSDILYEGEIVSIRESCNKFCTKLTDDSGKEYGPICSIDYIRNTGGDLVAIDFNEVQCLKMFNGVVSASEVVDEIKWYYNLD